MRELETIRFPWPPVRAASSVSELLLDTARPAGLPLRAQAGAIDFLPAQIHLVDLSRVADAVERIALEDDEVGIAAGGHHPPPRWKRDGPYNALKR